MGEVQLTSQVSSDDRLTREVSKDKAPQKHHSEEDEGVNELQDINIFLTNLHRPMNFTAKIS